MKRLAACAFLLLSLGSLHLRGQAVAAGALAAPGKAKSAEKDPVKNALGGNAPAPLDKPIVTEIYADEASFDSENYIGVFSGHVIVNDPRFNIQSDKLTIYLSKGDSRGLERAVAEGNVGVVREQPDPKGGPATRSIGRAESAVYTTKDGNVELKGSPRVQSGLNTHAATSPDTIMVINQSGQLLTRGPSRTEIRQDPKTEATKR